MIDPFGRTVDYLRVSVTDRCDFRCVYCMSENMTFLPKRDLLTLEELDRLCSGFITRGVRKLRLTAEKRRLLLNLIGSINVAIKGLTNIGLDSVSRFVERSMNENIDVAE